MMWFKSNWLILLLWAGVIFVLLRVYVSGHLVRFLDSANHRSLHHGQVLTGGGLIMFIPLTGIMLWLQLYIPAILLLCLTLLGAVDDVKQLSARFRFLVQVVVTVTSLWLLGFELSLWWLFLCVAMLWWLNLFNFMDGANGLVAMHAIVTLLWLLLMHALTADYILLIAMTVVALLVYLYFNVVKKALFMGDSGSLPLAFVIALTSLIALKTDTLTALQIAVMHAVLITDGTLTLAVRAYRRERLTEAHRSHLYQRLISNSISHWKISVAYATVTAVCCLVVYMMTELSLKQQMLWFVSVYAILAVVFFHSRSIGR
ncbi:MraY family glycosyltransferase [Marinicella gelatinilytica]|uniref:hypothetical protein n=1 Tax=Marinicella gelatinilytica TaxID=2996017 RepID=UPI002260CD13|nr:hypothetical protein [Marinicella gelatinilytica]MCX7543929.1 hypothetical protein [Marinicella gelatinilytica]